MSARPSIVFVHGAGGTPGTWSAVEARVTQAGYDTLCVTNPLTSLTDDVAHTLAALDDVDAPVLLVGHSYGGAVITNVGNDPRVVGLIYVAAFAPTQDETVSEIVNRYDAAPVSRHMQRGPNGEWSSSGDAAYWDEIGWDVPVGLRDGISQERRASADRTFSEASGAPAWRRLPAWYVVAAQDRTLSPEIQRDMAARAGAVTSELPGSHYTPWTQPDALATLIESVSNELGA